MKYVVIIPDGCSDEPQSALDGRTPLAAAETPAMNRIAERGIVGRANHVPPGFASGSAVANMSLLGFSPVDYFTGRAPIEAVAQGIELDPDEIAIRCNLVTIADGVMKSFTAGQISSEDARTLLDDLQEAVGLVADFKPGVSYRNLVVCQVPSDSLEQAETHPPHDVTDKPIESYLPKGSPVADQLLEWMNLSQRVFAKHQVNERRVSAGKLPATQVWLWGLGKRPGLDSFATKFGIQGAMITAVDLLRGLAKLIGWSVVDVPGATGYLDTDYGAKGEAAIQCLESHDIVCVHVEATDEASHEGNLDAKIEALQSIDQKIVAPILAFLESCDSDWRILVTPDHPTFLRTKTHSLGHVPFAICGAGIRPDVFHRYDEETCGKSEICFDRGDQLMPCFLNPEYGFNSKA